jgi:hypothetical protein
MTGDTATIATPKGTRQSLGRPTNAVPARGLPSVGSRQREFLRAWRLKLGDLLHQRTKLFARRRKEIETLARRLKEGTQEPRVEFQLCRLEARWTCWRAGRESG